MIKSIEVTALAKSMEDFKALVRLLESLGIRKDLQGSNDSYHYAEFFPAALQLDVTYGKRSGNPHADLFLRVTDPDSAFEVVKKRGFKLLGDFSPPKMADYFRFFDVELPSGTRVRIGGNRVEVVGDVDLLTQTKLRTIVRVPGAFEIPLAARTFAETKAYDAIICIGCLLRGDTAHYDVIVNEVTRGIGQSAQDTGVPHAFGVLTCDTLEQAIDRAGLKMGNKGSEAALAAIEMANLRAVSRQPSAVRKNSTKRPAKKARR